MALRCGLKVQSWGKLDCSKSHKTHTQAGEVSEWISETTGQPSGMREASKRQEDKTKTATSWCGDKNQLESQSRFCRRKERKTKKKSLAKCVKETSFVPQNKKFVFFFAFGSSIVHLSLNFVHDFPDFCFFFLLLSFPPDPETGTSVLGFLLLFTFFFFYSLHSCFHMLLLVFRSSSALLWLNF